MRTISTEDLASIAAGDLPHNWLFLLDFPSGLYGLHMGNGPFEFEGVTYEGAGSVLTIEQIDSGVDLSASPVKVTLRAVPDAGLTVDVLATIEDQSYKNRPATLTLIYFDKATGEPSVVIPWWRGFVDTIEHENTPGGDYFLVGNLEPRSLDHSRRGFRMRSDSDQKLIDPTDRIFEHAATVPTEKLPYGRKGEIGGGGGSGGGTYQK